MKLNFFIFVLLSINYFFAPLVASDFKKISMQARAAYDRKDYENAYNLYESIEDKGCAPFYNMGNCRYKTGDYIQAIVCWQKALKCADAEDYNDIAYNIQVAEDKLGFENKTETSLEKFNRSISRIPLIVLQLLFLALLFSLFFFIKKYKHGTKYRTHIISITLLIGVIFFLILVMRYKEDSTRKGIIMKTNVVVFAGPNEQYHKLGEVSIATRVAIIEQRDDWCKIKNKELSGWLQIDNLVVI